MKSAWHSLESADPPFRATRESLSATACAAWAGTAHIFATPWAGAGAALVFKAEWS